MRRKGTWVGEREKVKKEGGHVRPFVGAGDSSHYGEEGGRQREQVRGGEGDQPKKRGEKLD